ncbi:helix-turn-helix domain-containing protein, partial [Kitasatospora sp. NPDC036755]|uniref:PucR family transcriptional regulator n=1 Tax=Kitasatospora sp. NPDC036755 TaxID=3154600 RepID=UPI0033C68F92
WTPPTASASGPRRCPPSRSSRCWSTRPCRSRLGRAGEGASARALGFLGVLLGDGHDVDGFVGATLGPLLAYDARRGTELVRTLRAYFDCGGSLTRAKDELHVHVNTVVQRLDRVEALLGRDWSRPERSLELQLALRLQLLAGG